MNLRTIDLTYRGRDYRLAEPARSAGHARVTYLSPTSLPLECSACGRAVRHGQRLVLASIFAYHPDCAIRVGALELQPRQWLDLRDESRNLARDLAVAEASIARLRAQVAW